jgi:dephospho-CoA kinase
LPDPSLIGLTGGIAAGKSEVLAILGELGAETLSTDAVVHDLLGSDPAVRSALVDRWGARVAPGGELDRGRIAGIVFEEPDELGWLESVLHPRVGERVAEWRRSLPDHVRVAVVEVPLLFEGRMAEICDQTIAVIADDDLRERRASARGTGELEARDARQLSQADKAERATHVIRNNGTLDELRDQLRSIYPDLEAGAT